MRRSLLLLLSLMVIFSSSCSMKKMLWEQLEIASAVPAKPYSSKGISVQGSVAALEICDATIGDVSWDEAEVIPAGAIKAPVALLPLLWVFSLASPRLLQQQQHSSYAHFNYSHTGRVPIYLKLGRLTYYS